MTRDEKTGHKSLQSLFQEQDRLYSSLYFAAGMVNEQEREWLETREDLAYMQRKEQEMDEELETYRRAMKGNIIRQARIALPYLMTRRRHESLRKHISECQDQLEQKQRYLESQERFFSQRLNDILRNHVMIERFRTS